LALPHRLKRGPFHDVQASLTDLDDRVEQIMSEYQEGDDAQPSQTNSAATDKKKVSQ
jgi:hypothetical protein